MPPWNVQLAAARERLDVTQAELARRSHVSLPSIKAYERGIRHPSRPFLIAILDALRIDRIERTAILEAAGFSNDSFSLGPWGLPGFTYTLDEAAAYIETHPWPAFVTGEFMHVAAANTVAQRLWGVDLSTEFLDPIDRNLLSVASNPRFAGRVENLPEALEVMAAIFKHHHRGSEDLAEPSPYFQAVLKRFLAGDPAFVQPFLEAFQRAEPRQAKIRWEYPVTWCDPTAGRITFKCLVSSASEPDGLAFNDWIPTTASSWTTLTTLASAQ